MYSSHYKTIKVSKVKNGEDYTFIYILMLKNKISLPWFVLSL